MLVLIYAANVIKICGLALSTRLVTRYCSGAQQPAVGFSTIRQKEAQGASAIGFSSLFHFTPYHKIKGLLP
jgi:hypothetical protein